MKTPFTTEQFLDVFKNYNQAIFPLQIVFYLLAVIAIYLALKPSKKSGIIISGILAFFWLWMGVVYHISFFTAVNKAAYIFGVLFIVQGIIFMVYGVFKNKFSFRFNKNTSGVAGLIMIVYGLLVYPLLGYLVGHIYPYSPTFGLPCPTSIFTFGILLLSIKKVSAGIVVIPLLWAIIGFSAVISFKIYEDAGLLAAGLITFILLLNKNRQLKQNNANISI